jgi:signal peptidase I
MPQMTEDNNQKEPSSFWELVKYAVVALIIVVPFRIFIAQPYVVSGSSMDPTFKNGDYLIVDQLSKRFEEPARGSVVIIRYPKDPSKFFIKRLIAFPNERVEIRKGVVTIFNKEQEQGLVLDDSYIVYKKGDDFSIQLGEDEYFVMGDNRANSSDSRVWGTLPKKYIIGQPILRLLPIEKMGLWPGIQSDKQ